VQIIDQLITQTRNVAEAWSEATAEETQTQAELEPELPSMYDQLKASMSSIAEKLEAANVKSVEGFHPEHGVTGFHPGRAEDPTLTAWSLSWYVTTGDGRKAPVSFTYIPEDEALHPPEIPETHPRRVQALWDMTTIGMQISDWMLGEADGSGGHMLVPLLMRSSVELAKRVAPLVVLASPKRDFFLENVPADLEGYLALLCEQGWLQLLTKNGRVYYRWTERGMVIMTRALKPVEGEKG
jgi:hypothetical protein